MSWLGDLLATWIWPAWILTMISRCLTPIRRQALTVFAKEFFEDFHQVCFEILPVSEIAMIMPALLLQPFSGGRPRL